MRLKAMWGRIPEWGKAFLIAIGLLAFAHLFVLRWVTVRSTSMYGTLLPGDLVGVERWPIWTGVRRGDMIVFRDPVQDDRPKSQRQLLVKRVVALPGDDVELRKGKLFVNDLPVVPYPRQTSRWTVRLKEGTVPTELLEQLGLPPDYVLQGRTLIDLPLNAELASELRKRPDVVSLQPGSEDAVTTGHLFPFSPNYKWSNNSYGPVHVPAAGDTVAINSYTLPLYDRIISRYEDNKVVVTGGELRINGKPADPYVINGNYYFVLGDSRDFSSDSRYWGFVPADQVVGRAGFVLLNARSLHDRTVPRRTLKAL